MKKILLSLLFLLAFAVSAQAATYCVSTTGSDSADGIDDGSPACWLTIQKALNTVAAGDTVNVRAGTYRQRLTVMTSGTAENRITFQGESGAIIDGGDVQTGWASVGSGVYSKSNAAIGFTPGTASWGGFGIGWIAPNTGEYAAAMANLSTSGASTYWDGRIAQAGAESGITYIRHRDNTSPNSVTVTLSPINVGAITFTNKSYVTFRGFTIQNGYDGVRISGGGNNVIESNTILNFVNGIYLADTTNANTIQSNNISQNLIYTDFGHPRSRSNADAQAFDVTRQDGDLAGTGVFLNGAGTGNVIQQNRIYRNMAGIWLAGGSSVADNFNASTIIAENTIENCADFCVLPNFTTAANTEIRDNTFHEFHEGFRWGPVYRGPIYVYRNKFTMDSYAAEITTSGGASVLFASTFGTPFPATGVYIYHNTFSGSGTAMYWNDCGNNTYWINNIFSSKRFFVGPFISWGSCPGNPNPVYFNYNWIGGAGAFNPPPGNANNLIQNNTRIWAEGPNTLNLPETSNARNMGQDLSTTWDAGAGGSKSALPGMLPGYFSGSQPDAGAVQFTGAPSGSPGSVQLSSATYSVSESGTNATITLTRTGGSLGAASVQLATSNGTATAGSDYTAVSTTVSWTDGESANKTVLIPITSDVSDESNETVTLTLSNVGGATLGTPNTATLTIVDDDDPPSAGTLQFSSATYTVAEDGTSVTITVTRSGGTAGAVGVTYTSSNGTATAGVDYTAVNSTLSWSDAESTSKTFNITIANEGTTYEGNETVDLALSSATGGATIGSPSTAVLTITDDDPAPAGLMARWQFDEASGAGEGATSLDSSGNGRHVSLRGSGGAALGSGKITFAGGENDYADAQVGTQWTDDFTIVLDVQAASTGQAQYSTIFNNYANWFVGGTSDSFQIDVDGGSPGNYRFNTSAGVGNFGAVTTNRQILVARKSGTTLSLFNDCVLTGDHTVSSTAGNTFRHYVFGINRAGTIYWQGSIHDAWLYRGALTDGEIAAFCSAGTPDAPSNMAVVRSTTADVLSVTWDDNADDETSVALHQNVAAAGYGLLASLNPNTTSYSAPIVTAGAQHCFKSLMSNNSGDSAFATEACITAPPMQPTNVSANPGDEQALIAWQNVGADVGGTTILMRAGAAVGSDRPTDGQSYSVNDTIGSSTVVFHGAPLTPNFTKTGLTNTTTYHFAVCSRSVSGNRYSVCVPVSTTPVDAPPPQTAGNRTLRGSVGTAAGRGTAVNRGVRQ